MIDLIGNITALENDTGVLPVSIQQDFFYSPEDDLFSVNVSGNDIKDPPPPK